MEEEKVNNNNNHQKKKTELKEKQVSYFPRFTPENFSPSNIIHPEFNRLYREGVLEKDNQKNKTASNNNVGKTCVFICLRLNYNLHFKPIR